MSPAGSGSPRPPPGTPGKLALGLFSLGFLQPLRFVRTLFAPRGLWVLAGILALGVAQVEDVGVHYFLGEPRIEELLELVASICLFGFAADLAARSVSPGAPPASV